MPYYKFKDVANNLTIENQGYWLFIPFNIGQLSSQIGINNGYFAAYLSQSSRLPAPGKIDTFAAPRNYQIADGDYKFDLNNAVLKYSMKFEYGNELNQLLLFEFDIATPKTSWFSENANPNFIPPPKTANGSPLVQHKISFGNNIQGRYVYSISTMENHMGTENVLIVCPFLDNPLLKHILSNVGGIMPQLTVNTQKEGQSGGANWVYFGTHPQPLPGIVDGFVMATQGAFHSIDLNMGISNWINYAGKTEMIVSELSKIAHRGKIMSRKRDEVSKPFIRTVETADLTNVDSVYPESGERPKEILYLTGLNTSNPVPPILFT